MRIILLLTFFFSLAIPVFAGQVDVTLQIPIGSTQRITVCSPSGTALSCAGVASYIAVIYRWLVGFAAILAVLALTWGGVLWLTSGGDTGKIQEAQKVMGNSIIGLLIALLSYLLLASINVRLVQYNPLRVKPIQKIEFALDPPEELVRSTTSSATPGACCPSGDIIKIFALMNKNGVNDAAGFASKYTAMKPELFGAIQIVLEQCPEPGLVITSTIRPESTGSWHQKGGAIDFAGKICGEVPKKLCDSEKAKNMIASLIAAGYQVGTHQGTCSTFRDLGTGPHLHVEVSGSP